MAYISPIAQSTVLAQPHEPAATGTRLSHREQEFQEALDRFMANYGKPVHRVSPARVLRSMLGRGFSNLMSQSSRATTGAEKLENA